LLSNVDHGGHVHVDLDTLATALYVKLDDESKALPKLNRRRPKVVVDHSSVARAWEEFG